MTYSEHELEFTFAKNDGLLKLLQQPFQARNDAVVECCCWTSGTITATLTVNKRCFVSGESIVINAEIVNNSQTDITSTRAALKQVRYVLQRRKFCYASLCSHLGPSSFMRDASVHLRCYATGVIFKHYRSCLTGLWNLQIWNCRGIKIVRESQETWCLSGKLLKLNLRWPEQLYGRPRSARVGPSIQVLVNADTLFSADVRFILSFFFFLFYSTFTPDFGLAAPSWKQARSSWNP